MASRNFTITQDGESRNFTVETGVGPRGAVGPTGPPVDIAETIHAATEKATIADADEFGQADSESGWSLKKTTWATIKATIKTYFDTIYDAIGSASSAYDSAIQRANHTGTQAQSTVLNLVSDLAGKAPTSHTHTFASLTSKPTTLDGYGITDATPAPLELTAPPEDGVTVASQLGQLAIATIDGEREYSFRAVNLSPMTWEGATPGLLYNATLSEWRIATLTGADGSESITYGPL